MRKKSDSLLPYLFPKKFWIPFFICLAAFFVIRSGHFVRVSGTSMEPTLHGGDILHVETKTVPDGLKAGSIVVLDQKEDGTDHLLIKRIVGFPGDVLEIRLGRLYRNGVLENDSYGVIDKAGLLAAPYYVRDGHVFVMGDNRNASYDSRNFGAVPIEQVVGTVEKR